MIKFRFYLLWFLFFFTPIIYAWLYIPGVFGDLSTLILRFFPSFQIGGFEATKVGFFLVMMCILVLVTISIRIIDVTMKPIPRGFLIALVCFLLWSLVSLQINLHSQYFIFGNVEKTHGWYFYVAFFPLIFSLYSLPNQERNRLLLASILGYGVVLLYMYFQMIGRDPLQTLYDTRLDRSRLFSTLGNPNYLAGLALMMMPILLEKVQSTKYKIQSAGIILFTGLVLYLTGSYFAWGIFAGYIMYLLLRRVLRQRLQGTGQAYYALIGTILIILLVLYAIYNHYGNALFEMQKVKGFIARWFLWDSGFRAIIADPLHFLFGYGPDGFLTVSEQFRHPLLSNGFEDPAYRIDRAHNVFIDFIIHFGVPMFVAVMWIVSKNFRHLDSYKKTSVILFALYFSFNIPVLVHYLLLAQILTAHDKR